MGLLDAYNQANNGLSGLLGGMAPDQSRALQTLALGLLSNSGWNRTPVSLGQAFGNSGLQALQAQDEYKQHDMRQKLLQSQLNEQNYQAQQRQNDETTRNAISGYVDAGLPMDQKNFGRYLAQMPSAKYQEQGLGMLGPQKPVEVGPGGVIVDPMTGEVRYQNPLNRNGNQYGMTPVWGQDAQGNPVLMQMNSAGGIAPVQLPPGVRPSPGLQYKDLGGSVGGFDRFGNMPTSVPKTLQPDQQPGYIQQKKAAEVTGETTAKRDSNMSGLGTIIDTARAALTNKKNPPTQSGVGTVIDKAGTIVGATPKGAATADQLRAIAGALVAKMPRMEGPQSNYDVQNYKDMAGQVGDSTLPIERRLAALQVVESLWRKYDKQGQQPATPAPSGGAKFLGFE